MSVRAVIAARIALASLAALLAAGPASAKAPFAKPDLYAMGRQSSKQGDFVRAAAAFEDMLRAEATGFTLQLAVVCERDTIARFTDTVDAEDGFYFLATNVKGRPCFKALWGVFPSAEAARAAALPPGIDGGGGGPVPVPVAKLLHAAPPPPPPAATASLPPPPAATSLPPASAAKAPASAPRATGAGGKTFTDSDLKGYRSKREAEEAKYGTPKPLFEEVDLRTLDPPKAEKGKKGSKKKDASAPLPDPVTITSPPAKDDEAYWKTLVGNAKETVETKRKAHDAATARGDAAASKAAEAELSAAEGALADLRARAAARGAAPAWLD